MTTTANSRRSELVSYSISQLARTSGLTVRALRFYEQLGLLSPSRRGLRRLYGRGDFHRARVIAGARQAGLSLPQARELLELYDARDGGEAQLRRACEQLTDRAAQLAAQCRCVLETLDQTRARLRQVRGRKEA